MLAASRGAAIAAGARADGAGAHLGSGVDVQAYRRIRDAFLDVQFRAPGHELGEQAARRRASTAPSSRSPSPATTASTPSSPSSGTPGRTSPTPPSDPAARQALLEQGARSRTALHDRRRPARAPSRAQAAPSTTRARPAARRRGRRASPPSSPQLNDTIKRCVTAGDTPERPARPPRPAARPALRARPGLASPSWTRLAAASPSATPTTAARRRHDASPGRRR